MAKRYSNDSYPIPPSGPLSVDDSGSGIIRQTDSHLVIDTMDPAVARNCLYFNDPPTSMAEKSTSDPADYFDEEA